METTIQKITWNEICKAGEGKSIREADIAIADLLKERMGVGKLEFNSVCHYLWDCDVSQALQVAMYLQLHGCLVA